MLSTVGNMVQEVLNNGSSQGGGDLWPSRWPRWITCGSLGPGMIGINAKGFSTWRNYDSVGKTARHDT